MDETAPLKVTHDVSQTLQRKIEGKFSQPRHHKGHALIVTQV